ncbi:MAG: LptE family protein [Deltaproteobacteria bacterium]|nr:LptE family protein [Candidatus Anaeroferrophillacea bacterium]
MSEFLFCRRRGAPALLAVVVLAVSVAGCLGYRFADYTDTLPERLQTVAVEPFVNRTYESLVETWITSSVVAEFARSQRLEVADLDCADVIIRGSITDVTAGAIGFAGSDRALEYRVYVTIEATAEDRRQDRVLWRQANMVEVEEYLAMGTPVADQSNKREAIRKACDKLAANIHDRLFDAF